MIEVEIKQSHKPPRINLEVVEREREREREMEVEGSRKKSISSILKKLERYVSFNSRRKSWTTARSKSWSGGGGVERRKAAPNGCLSVYVGPEKQRFVIKTEVVNHPLFKALLEDAEMEYGFSSDGPLLLPCHVDLFYRVLAEMECGGGGGGGGGGFGYHYQSPCGFGRSPFRTVRRRFSSGDMSNGVASYGLLTPLRSLEVNRF